MIKYQIFYTNYPECPDATDLSQSRAELNNFVSQINAYVCFGCSAGALFSFWNVWSEFKYLVFGGFFIASFLSFLLWYYCLEWWDQVTNMKCENLIIKILNPDKKEIVKAAISARKAKMRAQIWDGIELFFFKLLAGYFLVFGVYGCGLNIYLMAEENYEALGLVISAILLVLGIFLGIKSFGFAKLSSAFTDKFISSFKLKKNNTLQSMYCRKCGEKIPGDSTFCTKCGTKVE